MADRFAEYMEDPVVTGTAAKPITVPFFQALASITASGKTVILADAVQTISATLPIPPLVLWLSKGKVVVEQSYANLAPGGKYHHLLGDADVATLAEFDPAEARQSNKALVYFATVGTFNQKDKDEGALLIYRSDIDTAEQSTWQSLHQRLGSNGLRRPLIVVYDEAHNLSDQQTDLLLELEPDAFLLASATMRLPRRLGTIVDLLKQSGRPDTWLVTSVDAQAVVNAGLVKNTVLLAGYQAPMEETISALLADMADASAEAVAAGLESPPKAIYVSKTNIVEGDASRRDDPSRPFDQREAPPILIWRYLVSQGVSPDQIAVYCSLKFDKAFPPPDEFRHFKGGDKDFDLFSEGDFRHIIFNLSLQEGWDDPFCYFAYVDKSMESTVQVEQIIGRALRQPNGRHYASDRLNTAHFYIRVDRSETFATVLDAVAAKLEVEAPEVRIIRSAPGRPAPQSVRPAGDFQIPSVAIRSENAVGPVKAIIDNFTDYRHDDGSNTLSEGSRSIVRRLVGAGTEADVTWETFRHSNSVRARWLFDREVRRRHQGALGVVNLTDPKFDSLVGLRSKAHAHVTAIAEQVVEAYLDNVHLAQRRVDPFVVGPLLVRVDEAVSFSNALHGTYDGLNSLELTFAKALDRIGVPWCRNPPRTGFGIPLVSLGATSIFYPDFVAWNQGDVYAIDTKGGHLLPEAAARKLLKIEHPDGVESKLYVRFLSEGHFNRDVELESRSGFTAWGVRHDGTRQVKHYDSVDEAVAAIVTP
jgi:type III restriction enzyme